MTVVSTDIFPVRAHHARLLNEIYAFGDSPEGVAAELRHNIGRTITRLANRRGYQADVYGVTQTQSDAAVNAMASYLQAFIDLPPDASVEFGLRKDGICASTAKGSHCDKVLRPGDNADSDWLIALSKTTATLGLTEEVQVERALYERWRPFGSRQVLRSVALRTNALTARKLLGDPMLRVGAEWFMFDPLIVRRQIKKRLQRQGLIAPVVN